LIETKGGDVNMLDTDSMTPIHIALRDFEPNYGGHFAVLAYLLDQKGINSTIKGQYGHTLLHLACQNINKLTIDIFKCLVETHHCDLNVLDEDGNTPLYYALQLFKLHLGNDIAIFTYLLSQDNIEINIKCGDGRTLLHTACLNINELPLDAFKCLIETQLADVNVLDTDNNTPLRIAIERFDPNCGGDITVLNYLIDQNGVNVNLIDQPRGTLLHLVCIRNLGPCASRYSRVPSRPGIRRNPRENADTFWSHIVEIIVQKSLQLVVDEISL
jgi:ankyrin repeat protein